MILAADAARHAPARIVRHAWLIILLLVGCSPSPDERLTTYQGPTMGTRYTVKVTDQPAHLAQEAVAGDITKILDDVNAAMSTYREDSELSRFNRNRSGDWVSVSAALAGLVAQARGVSERSAGAFDVTVGPLVNLWGFGPSSAAPEPPDGAQLLAARARVGYQWLQVRTEAPALRKERPDIYVDLSAIAKGYGVDQVAEHLGSLGVMNYMVEIGGEIRAKGVNPHGEPWRIAIEKPVVGARAVQRILAIGDAGMATSGDYRNFVEHEGKRYSHTIDPRTAQPIAHRLASVTVVHPRAALADAWATALMVLGPGDGQKTAESLGLAAYFVVRENDAFAERHTAAFGRLIED